MLIRVCLGIMLFTATPVWCQLEAIPFETSTTASDNSRMLTPPPVSGVAYPNVVGSETRSNYLAAGVTFNTAYDDNVLTNGSSTPISDFIYSISPTIILNQTTVRQQLGLTVSPGFTFYQRTSVLNATNQDATLDYQYRLSPHTTIRLADSFQKSSNYFDQLDSAAGEGISGSTLSPPAEVIVPFADRLNNAANAAFSYQLSRNGMIGASGIVTESNYLNSAQASGLYNSTSLGGSVFYSRRLSSAQYVGVTYQYIRSQNEPVDPQANPMYVGAEVQTHTLLPFYTIYFGPTFSLSLSAGPQHFDAAQAPSPSIRSWEPSALASIGWQRSHTNLAASYSRTIAGSIGLPGAFESSNASASASWQMTRTWSTALAIAYANNNNATPSFSPSYPGGHSLSGTVSVKHSMGEHLTMEFGYARLHQSYSGVAAISADPDCNREYISVSYRLTRPLGR